MDIPTDAAIIVDGHRRGSQRRWRVSPLNERRWQIFKAHERGYWSLWIFLVLFVLSLFAEFIANDRPLIVNYDGHYYFPVFKSYPETAFGGIFETEAVYRDPAVKEMIDGEGRLDSLAADPLLLQHAEQEPANGLSGEADLDADRGRLRQARSKAASTLATTSSNGTGSAPTTRAAMSSRASSTVSASRCCSGSC